MRGRLEGKVLGDYRILWRVGGTLGTTYLAEQVRIARRVAVKVLFLPVAVNDGYDDDSAEILLREARALASLDHPNILPIFDLCYKNGIVFSVLPFIPHGSLHRMLVADDSNHFQLPLVPKQLTTLVSEISNALQYAHDSGITHGNIKPSNILIRRESEDCLSYLLSDFHLSHVSNGNNTISNPAYAAPEVWRGEISPASDQYALGVLLYLLLTGKLPFTGTPEMMKDQHLNTSAVPIHTLNTEVNPELSEAIFRLLDKDAGQRYQNIADFKNVFNQLVSPAPIQEDGITLKQEDILKLLEEERQKVTYDLQEQLQEQRRRQEEELQAQIQEQLDTRLQELQAQMEEEHRKQEKALQEQLDQERKKQHDLLQVQIKKEQQKQMELQRQELQKFQLEKEKQDDQDKKRAEEEERRRLIEQRRVRIWWDWEIPEKIARQLLAPPAKNESVAKNEQPTVPTSKVPSGKATETQRPRSKSRKVAVEVEPEDADTGPLAPSGTADDKGEFNAATIFHKSITRRSALALAAAGVTASVVAGHTIFANSSGNSPIIAVLRGHSAPVKTVAFAPNKSLLATGSLDGTIRLWDEAALQNIKILQGRKSAVNAVSWSPDSQEIGSGTADQMLTIWNIVGAGVSTSMTENQGPLYAVAWSPEGNIVATSSSNNAVTLWDTDNNNVIMDLTGHTGIVRSISWSPDGNRIATGSDDGTVIVWDASTGSRLATMIAHTGQVYSVCWSTDDTMVASGSADGLIQIWDASTARILRTFSGHTKAVRSVQWCPDGIRLVSAGDDMKIMIWNTQSSGTPSNLPLHIFEGHKKSVNCVAWLADGSRLVSGSDDQTAIVWATPGL